MRTTTFPPLCPFGGFYDCLTLRRPSSRAVVWEVSKNHYLRVNVYEDGDLSYLLGGRKEIQDDILESIDGIGDLIDVSDEKLLHAFRFTRVLKALNV